MRPEKQFLVEEINDHLGKSDYVFLTDYNRLNVIDTAELRAGLAKHDAEFHVIKNSLFNVAARERELPDMSEFLAGQTAIIVGGENPSEVAKFLLKFAKDKEKNTVKAGVMEAQVLQPGDVEQLSKMPSKEELRAKLMGLLQMPATTLLRLLNTPGQQTATVLNAPVQNLLNVLKAREDKLAS